MRKIRLSWHKQKRLLELFAAGSTARVSASLVGANKTTASYYFHQLRTIIYNHSQHMEVFEGEVEVDESYFGRIRKGERGRGVTGKRPVFDLLKRNGTVYTVVIPNAKIDTLMR